MHKCALGPISARVMKLFRLVFNEQQVLGDAYNRLCCHQSIEFKAQIVHSHFFKLFVSHRSTVFRVRWLGSDSGFGPKFMGLGDFRSVSLISVLL
jgi:hypothetical protein